MRKTWTAWKILFTALESLLTIAGLHRILPSLVTNFTGFAPLGEGRHPLAGLAAAFAGVSGGFCANFLLGPELTQAGYRIGDSVANIITPLMSYFPLVVAFSQRYDKHAGIGTY